MSIYDGARVFAPALIDKFKNPIQAEWQRKVNTPNGQGGTTPAWVTIKSVDIAILPKSGTDTQRSQRTENIVKTIAYCKFSDFVDLQDPNQGTVANFNNSDRLLHDGLIYRVEGAFDIAKAKAVIKFEGTEGRAT